MTHLLTSVRPPRIEVVDALRGFAVLAIVLVHNIEHFNLYIFPETTSPLLASVNTFLWEAVFFIFGGKAYAIFALLFGFSFHVQEGVGQTGSLWENEPDELYRTICDGVVYLLWIWPSVVCVYGDGSQHTHGNCSLPPTIIFLSLVVGQIQARSVRGHLA